MTLPDDPTIPPGKLPEPAAAPGPAPAETVTGSLPVPPSSSPRPELIDRREPLYRELPDARGKSDEELGEAFFDGQADRLAASVADDVTAPAELRVVVDPYSRQAFVALDKSIRGILSF